MVSTGKEVMATRGRKTASVEYIVAEANLMLSRADGPANPGLNPEVRKGVIALTEAILHATDNYRGFQYLDTEFVREYLPGGDRRVLREDYDPTRVRFY
jgi:hypothetical protein